MTKLLSLLLAVSLLVPAAVTGQTRPGRVSTTSTATIANPAITFATSYAVPTRDFSDTFPEVGDQLLILGKVSAFQAPLEDLNASDPQVEFTYRIRNLAVVIFGFWDIWNEGGTFVNYSGGILEIYRDSSPDADFADAATFSDGDLILSARMTDENNMFGGAFELSFGSREWPSQSAGLVFTGGSLFDRVSDEHGAFTGYNHGDFAIGPGATPEQLSALGYLAVSQSSIDIRAPVPVAATTWGRIKSLYLPH